jgi:transaldolase/glucose-6-phosphate isomerase
MAAHRLAAVSELGQSIWYDNIRRGLIQSGELQRLIDEDSITGITSNPTIFEKAINGSDDYDETIRALVSRGVNDAQQVFETLAIEDIQAAADMLRPIYDRTHGGDGFISLEVSPAAANDTQRTIAEARHLFQRADRPNVMIKIPATAEGLPAIEQMVYEGVNINITLIFALEVYEKVAEAFIRGLRHRQADGQFVSGIASVASFFVSRVDTLVDKQLQERIDAASDDAKKEELRALLGTAAIANARIAYESYQRLFHGDHFAALRERGAAPQRCLWASTSTKNPSYRDVLYVEQLIGPETVDTMPPATIQAFQDHGVAERTLDTGDAFAAAHETVRRLAEAGIEMRQVTKHLEIEGVKTFADAYHQMIDRTGDKIARLRSEMEAQGDGAGVRAATDTSAAGASAGAGAAGGEHDELGELQAEVDRALTRAETEQFARRVWEKDPALWKPNPSEQSEITDRLGWLTVTETMREALPRLRALRNDVRAAGMTHAVLLGMGGSSLAPEVLRETFGTAEGQPQLIVLDTTDPATILDAEREIDLVHTIFIVASKSGGTIETLTQFAYFYEKVQAIAGDQAGRQFLAITDPGTKLETMGHDHHFREVFLNPPDIGGRYSALSFFGLVPAAIIGVDVEKLLDRADAMRAACAPDRPAHENPGLRLGAILGTLANGGRDKVTLVMSPPISTFGYWIEQLIAESTGKEGKGILPVEGERLGPPEVYGSDRLFVSCRTEQGFDAGQDEALRALAAAGQPVVALPLRDRYDLGAEFFRWEFATAIAGALLGINAFDQPNVQEAKDRTDAILKQYAAEKALPRPPAILRTEQVAIVAGEDEAHRLAEAVSLQAALEAYLRQVRPGDYVALLAYVRRGAATQEALERIRLRIRDLCHVATTLGYGPRFQHSTGQLHKGGANNGVFIQFVADDHEDAPIPGRPFTFGTLKQAQALGDLQALEAHERRAIRINLGASIAGGLGEVGQALDAAQLQRG